MQPQFRDRRVLKHAPLTPYISQIHKIKRPINHKSISYIHHKPSQQSFRIRQHHLTKHPKVYTSNHTTIPQPNIDVRFLFKYPRNQSQTITNPQKQISKRHNIQKRKISKTPQLTIDHSQLHITPDTFTDRNLNSKQHSEMVVKEAKPKNTFRKNKFFKQEVDTPTIHQILNTQLIHQQHKIQLEHSMEQINRKIRSRDIQLSVEKSSEKYLEKDTYRPLKSKNDIEIYVSTVCNPTKNVQSHESTIHTFQKNNPAATQHKTIYPNNDYIKYQFEFNEEDQMIQNRVGNEDVVDEMKQQLIKQLLTFD